MTASKQKQDWIGLGDSPFTTRCAKLPLLVDDNTILLSCNYNEYVHLFNIKTDSWTKQSLPILTDFEGYVMCLSKDKQKLYLYEGFEMELVIVDIKTMKIEKTIENLQDTGAHPVIMIDDTNSNIIHVIGGQSCNKHIEINTNTTKMNTIYCFGSFGGIPGAGLVYITHKNIWLYFGYELAMHEYNVVDKKWTNTKIKMPQNLELEHFGYVLTLDERYIVIIGGAYWKETWNVLRNIILFDVDNMRYIVTKKRSPIIDEMTFGRSRMTAVMTKSGDIHVFEDKYHWKINIDKIIQPSDVIIYGYVRKYIQAINIPTDILKIIQIFFGSVFNTCTEEIDVEPNF